MLRDLVQYYYMRDYNCSESLLCAANEAYHLNIPEEYIRLISGFGGGLCCESTCGALCGSIATLSIFLVDDKAHTTPELKAACANLVMKFEKELGSTCCLNLKQSYRTEESLCLTTVQLAADVLEDCMQEIFKRREQS